MSSAYVQRQIIISVVIKMTEVDGPAKLKRLQNETSRRFKRMTTLWNVNNVAFIKQGNYFYIQAKHKTVKDKHCCRINQSSLENFNVSLRLTNV